jgi:hypothetical protein
VTTIPTSAPALSTGWLLRATALVTVAAAVMGLVISPGLHGNSGEAVVLWTDRGSAALAYFVAALFAALILWGTVQLLRAEVPVGIRAGLIFCGGAVEVLTLGGLHDRLPPQATVPIAAASAAAALVAGAFLASRGPHTRATAGVLFAFGLAASVRLGAWVIATRASDHADVQLFGLSRGLATAGVLFEAAGQLTAFTFGIGKGVHSGAALWQAMLHTALADAPGIPPSYRLDTLATFLVPTSLFLAFVVVAQPRQVAAITGTMALALVSRGAFDVPLRALAAAVAAQWAVLACIDDKAMWRTLIEDRKVRLAEDGVEEPHREEAPPQTPSV